MNKKTTGIIAYITWIGWIVAFCAGDKEGAKFHLNQALVILIGQIVAAVINYIPYVGGIVGTVLSSARQKRLLRCGIRNAWLRRA